MGRTATANTLAEVSAKITTWKQHRDNDKAPSPLPLTQCPWCATKLDPDTVTLFPNASAPTRVRISCKNFRGCDFGQGHKASAEDGIPLVFVDEQVYRELPSFLVATVDKFAMVPWRAEAGMLFGRVHSRVGGRFFGTPDTAIAERTAALLPDGLLPQSSCRTSCTSSPNSSARWWASTRRPSSSRETKLADGTRVRPKILASTATVRRARRQVLSLFGRDAVSLFPPPGRNEGETFFARVAHATDGRLTWASRPGVAR